MFSSSLLSIHIFGKILDDSEREREERSKNDIQILSKENNVSHHILNYVRPQSQKFKGGHSGTPPILSLNYVFLSFN